MYYVYIGAVSIQNLEDARKVHYPIPFSENMSEDCLYLNIWTPTATPDARLPVMVYIHGGSFIIGSGEQYDGSPMSSYHDVVMVTLNYRLGMLGTSIYYYAGIIMVY